MECIKFRVTKISVDCMMHFFGQIARPRALVAVVVHFGVWSKKRCARTHNWRTDVAMHWLTFQWPLRLISPHCLMNSPSRHDKALTGILTYWCVTISSLTWIEALEPETLAQLMESLGHCQYNKLGLIYVPAHSSLSWILGPNTFDINQWSLNFQPWSPITNQFWWLIHQISLEVALSLFFCSRDRFRTVTHEAIAS